VDHPGSAGPLLPEPSALASAAVVQGLCRNILDCLPPPRCAPKQAKRPRAALPGLQRQSFDTPPPQRVTGVSNQENRLGADDEDGAAGRRQGRGGSAEERQHEGEDGMREDDLQCRRQREWRERKKLGFLTGKEKGEQNRSPGERFGAIWDIGKYRFRGDNQGARVGPRAKVVGAQ
jgi:hypothetical protein